MANEFVARNGIIAKADSSITGTLAVSGNISSGGNTVATQTWVTTTALSGYATETYVADTLSDLIGAAPGTLDTLNELAAALGNDPNFATTVTNSIATKLPLAGGSMTGNINWTSTDKGLVWTMNTDGAYIKFFNTGDGDTNSRLEYGTSDNGNEYHRWMVSSVEEMNLKADGLRVTNSIWSAGNLVATQAWVGTQGFLTEEADPLFLASAAYNIDQASIDKWNTAFGWGDHSGLYAAASHTHSATDITSGTLASARLSGTYAISITGNAATATSASSAGTASTVNGSSGQLLRHDNRTIAPNEISSGYLQFGFTSFNNNNTAPWADYLHLRSYTDASGGNDNLLVISKSTKSMRLYQQSWNSGTAYSSYVDFWTTGDFTGTDVTNWNTAYSWGNHATAGYGSAGDTAKGVEAFGWGDHAAAGYLTSYSESDTLATVTARGNTTNGSINVNGDILLTGTATTTNQGRMIDFTGFDKEGTTDFSDRAYIQHTVNTGGHSGSVLVISSQNDSGDGIAFLTNASSKLKHNSNNIATEPWVSAQGYLTSLPAHTHPISEIDGLQDELDGKQPAGSYLTSYTETDTLATVTGRGATTSSKVFFTHNTTADPLSAVEINGGGNHTGLYINPAAAKQAHIRFGTNGTLKWQIRAPFQDGADTALKFYSWVSGDDKFVFNHNGSATFNGGTVWTSANDGAGSGLDADTLDGLQASAFGSAGDTAKGVTAFGWGDHAAAGYITDGNTNWNNSYGFITASDSITGTSAGVVRTVSGTSSAELVRGNMGDNDQARILVGATASNAGYLEIATADDGTEPIYVRQYTGVFSSLTRTATLLDGSGNTSFPGTVTASFSGSLSGNASTATKWATARTITLGGDLTGNVSIDGSANVTLTAAVVDDSHTHDGRYYTESESDARFVNVTGDTVTGNLAVSGASLSVTSTAAGSEAFYVDGVNGRLFTISDDLSDSLFSVNTISGLPVIEAFADNTVKIGPFSNPVTVDSSGVLAIGGVTAATQTYVDNAISGLIGGAPGALDTLNELAAAINDDASYASTITTALGTKAPLASPALTGTPTAPTAAAATNNTQIATTAFVKAQGYLTSLGFNYGTGVTANYVVQRDANGYIYANYINLAISETENPTVNSFIVSNGDGWTRKASVAHIKSTLGLGSAAYTASTDYAPASHNHTSLTGVTSIGFSAQSSDAASITTTISGTSTFFDFNLTDDNNNDWWRWRFTPSGSTVYDAMILKPVSNGNADLTVSGSVFADNLAISNWNTAYGWGNHAGLYLGATAKAADSNLLDGIDSSGFVRANGTTNDNIDSDWGQSFKTFDPVPGGVPPVNSPNIRTINVGDNYNRRTQIAFPYEQDRGFFRRRTEAGWFEWAEFITSLNIGSQSVSYATSSGSTSGNASTATTLQTARTINGTSFNGSANITTSTWGTARTVTIGGTSKSVNGGANVSWSLAEIGAAAASHTHSYLPLSGGTLTGTLTTTDIASSGDRLYNIGAPDNRYRIVFCETLDSAGLHESNLASDTTGFHATGTVLVWKDGEAVPCSKEADHMKIGIAVFGNSSPLVQGAEPVLVSGDVSEGDYLITSEIVGHAKAVSRSYVIENQLLDCVIGKALETASGESHLVKTWVTI